MGTSLFAFGDVCWSLQSRTDFFQPEVAQIIKETLRVDILLLLGFAVFFVLAECDRLLGIRLRLEAESLRNSYTSIQYATSTNPVDKESILNAIGDNIARVDQSIDVLLRAGMSTPNLRQARRMGMDIEGAADLRYGVSWTSLAIPCVLNYFAYSGLAWLHNVLDVFQGVGLDAHPFAVSAWCQQSHHGNLIVYIMNWILIAWSFRIWIMKNTDGKAFLSSAIAKLILFSLPFWAFSFFMFMTFFEGRQWMEAGIIPLFGTCGGHGWTGTKWERCSVSAYCKLVNFSSYQCWPLPNVGEELCESEGDEFSPSIHAQQVHLTTLNVCGVLLSHVGRRGLCKIKHIGPWLAGALGPGTRACTRCMRSKSGRMVDGTESESLSYTEEGNEICTTTDSDSSVL